MHKCQVVSDIKTIKLPISTIYFFSCSVACYQSHLTSNNCVLSNQDVPDEALNNIQLYPTEDTIPPEKLNLLCMY